MVSFWQPVEVCVYCNQQGTVRNFLRKLEHVEIPKMPSGNFLLLHINVFCHPSSDGVKFLGKLCHYWSGCVNCFQRVLAFYEFTPESRCPSCDAWILSCMYCPLVVTKDLWCTWLRNGLTSTYPMKSLQILYQELLIWRQSFIVSGRHQGCYVNCTNYPPILELNKFCSVLKL